MKQKSTFPKGLITKEDILKLKNVDTDAEAKEILYKIYLNDFWSICMAFGEDVILDVLEYLQEKEEYELCNLLIKDIEEINNLSNVKIRTRR